MPRLLLTLAFLALVGCGGPRQPILSREQAELDGRDLEVRVIEAFDTIRLPFPTETSHLIEVEVVEGPADLRGRVITLPYDEWRVGEPPPKAGTRLHISPRRWVIGGGDSRGKPFEGWEGRRLLDR